MLAVIAASSVAHVAAGLPNRVALTIGHLTADIPTPFMFTNLMPTHSLGVRSHLSTDKTPIVTLFPIHNIILAVHCANLPPLPPSKPTAPALPGAQIILPLVMLNIPHPATFPPILKYLYTRCDDQLLVSLLPISPAPTRCTLTTTASIHHLAQRLTRKYAGVPLLQLAVALKNGVWRNVCWLGISDEKLWCTMQLAWEVILTAIAFDKSQRRKTGV